MKLSLWTLCIALTAAVACAQPVGKSASYDPDKIGPACIEHKLGLRTCVQKSANEVEMVFGSSVNRSAAENPKSYRLMSETDPACQTGVWGTAAKVQSTDDVAYPAGWAGKKYPRYTVDVTFPVNMQEGHRYFIQVLGAKGPLTGGRSAMYVGKETADTAGVAKDNCLGIRHAELLTPSILIIDTGDGVNTALVDDQPGNFVVTSKDDPEYAQGRPAAKVGRRTQGDMLLTDGWPFKPFLKSSIFVFLDKPLQQGKTYSIDLNAKAPITCGQSQASLLVSDKENVNPFIKVNQLGYLPNAPAKYAYVGAWMGSAGALNLDDLAKEFKVCKADSGEVVLTGKPELRKRHAWSLAPDGSRQGPDKATETMFNMDLSYEDVWDMDLSKLTEPGKYYVTIPGMGRSFIFEVSPNVYAKAYEVGMIGVFNQRCGQVMTSDFSPFYRPACHRNMTELTTFDPTGPDTSIWGVIAKTVQPGTGKYDLYGGHHDAGDYNPRSHLDVAEMLLMTYDMAPKNFKDGQNHLPEAGNLIPDILDEARWQLDLWTRLQEPNGAVRGGCESNGDPDYVTPGDLDYKRDFAFAPSPEMSLRVAGAWALASELYRNLGAVKDADLLLARATKAYDWAIANPRDNQKYRDDLVLGSILMYRATGEEKYRQAFEKTSVFATKADADLEVYKQYDQQLASYYYASCPRPVDATLKAKIVKAYRDRMANWVKFADTTGYRWMKDPGAPNNWGSAAYPEWCITPMQAYMLTGEKDYLKWIILTADFSLGCDPMNTVFITRLGQRCISQPLHSNSRYAPNGPIPGIESEGPSTASTVRPGSSEDWPIQAQFPKGPWPQLLTYTDWCFSPSMSEGVVSDMAKNAAVYGFLLNVPEPKLAK